MKIRIVLLSILFANLSFAQKTDCFFHNERIDSTNVNNIINSLDTIRFGNTLSQSEFSNLLDCLFSIDSLNPKIRFYLATDYMFISNDTSYFKHYRYCIEKGFKTATSYFNIGAGYLNFLFQSNGNDSLRIYILTADQKSRIFNLAERNLWLSYSSGLKEAIFAVGEIQKLKYEYLKTPLPVINTSQDTLTIIAGIRDCGEFGGHIETIEIINNGKDNYTATFHSDSIFCQEEKSRLSDNSKYNGLQATASKDNIDVLISDINSYEDKGVISNAPFEIAILNKKDVLSRRINLNRTSYIDFRMKTFGF
jgi:hypothetical protein